MAQLSVDFSKLPDVIWMVRRELANLLRKEAETEASPLVAKRLRELAARFETGQGA